MKEITFVEIEQLKGHEEIRPDYLEALRKQILCDGILKMPIAVDRRTYVILDGHHRLQALKTLGCRKIPVVLVDYRSPKIKVLTWREGQKITKSKVVRAALSGRRMPSKTSKHMIIFNGKMEHISSIEGVINIPLDELR